MKRCFTIFTSSLKVCAIFKEHFRSLDVTPNCDFMQRIVLKSTLVLSAFRWFAGKIIQTLI